MRALLTAVTVLSTGAGPPLVVNEIYYDHPGADELYEFVELYNPGPDTLAIEDFRLELLAPGGTWVLLYDGGPYDLVPPGGFFLIGGDLLPIPPDDNLYRSLPNTSGSLRLLDASGRVLDLVGYGPNAPAFEGAPLPDVPAGWSLARFRDGGDSGDNARDFGEEPEPSPGILNDPEIDLALVSDRPSHRVEPGHAFAALEIANRGRLRAGAVRVGWSWEADGLEVARGETKVEPPPAGSRTPLRLPPPGLAVGLYRVRAALTAAGDQNPLDDVWNGPVRIGRLPVYVTEIMYRPSIPGGEWVEIQNRGDGPLDLTGWSLTDATGTPRTIETKRIRLEPGRFLVLCQDSLVFRRLHGRAVRIQRPRGGWPGLNDTESLGVADRVRLLDATGIPIEEVAYPDLLGPDRGLSLERPYPPAGPSLRPSWYVSIHPDGATPGGFNSQRASLIGDRVPVIEPNPFRPGEGACRIGFFLEPEFEAWSVRLFDLGGREVRRFDGSSRGGGWKAVEWDGHATGGRRLGPGGYVAAIVRTGGGRVVTTRHLVVLAGEGGSRR